MRLITAQSSESRKSTEDGEIPGQANQDVDLDKAKEGTDLSEAKENPGCGILHHTRGLSTRVSTITRRIMAGGGIVCAIMSRLCPSNPLQNVCH